jgi:hypothetical protein
MCGAPERLPVFGVRTFSVLHSFWYKNIVYTNKNHSLTASFLPKMQKNCEK